MCITAYYDSIPNLSRLKLLKIGMVDKRVIIPLKMYVASNVEVEKALGAPRGSAPESK